LSALVSIIIPCKNAERWLALTIASCLKQTWASIEIIVVDNLSLDNSFAIASSYSSANVKVLRCSRSGASAARNKGLEHAKGAYIQFLDADDLLAPDKIEIQMKRLADEPAGTLASGSWARFTAFPSDGTFNEDELWRDFSPIEYLVTSWLGGGMMAPFVWLTPMSLIKEVGGWDEEISLNDDGEFFCRVVLGSRGIVFCKNAKGYYRSTPQSLSKRRDSVALHSAYLAVERSTQALLRHSRDPMVVKACAYSYQRFVHDAYPLVPALTAAAEVKVKDLGGSDLEPTGGPVYILLYKIVGWKFARLLQRLWRRHRYRSMDI